MFRKKAKRALLSIDKELGLLTMAGTFGLSLAIWYPCLFWDCQ